MAQVLEGMRVLDLSSYIAGPLTGQLLAEQGAEVINAACFAQSGDFLDYEHRPTAALRNRGGQRLKEVQARTAYDYEVCSLVEAAFVQKGRDQWIAELEAAGVPCAPTLQVADILSPPHPHALATNVIDVNQHTRWGEVTQLGTTAKFSLTPGWRSRPAPLLGEHTVEVLQELGYSQSKIDELLERKIVGQQGINVAVR